MKERTGVDELVAVNRLPAIARQPGRVAVDGQRAGRRPERQRVQQQRLVVALPSVLEKAALRPVAVRERRGAVLRPAPVDTPVQLVGHGADPMLRLVVAIEVGGGGEGAGQQEAGIDR